MVKEVVIEEARIRDIPQIVEIWKTVLDWHGEFDDDYKTVKGTITHLEMLILDTLEEKNYLLFVAKKEKEIVGFIRGAIIQGTLLNRKNAVINDIMVKNEFKKMGIGKKLMKKFENEVEDKYKAHTIYLNVHVKNANALAFYEYLGYSKQTIKMKKTLRREKSN